MHQQRWSGCDAQMRQLQLQTSHLAPYHRRCKLLCLSNEDPSGGNGSAVRRKFKIPKIQIWKKIKGRSRILLPSLNAKFNYFAIKNPE